MVSRRLAGFLVLAALAVSAFVLAPAASQAGPNLLKNPGFEEGLEGHPWMPSGWDTSRAGIPTVFFSRDGYDVHGGKWAVNVASASALYNFAHNWSQGLVVGPEAWGKDLVFTAWTRSMGVDGRAYILLQAYRDTVSKMAMTWNVDREEAAERLEIVKINDPSIDLGWARDYFTENETPWTERTVRVFVPPGTNVVFVRCGIIGVGQVILDDASLTLEDARPPEPLPLNTNLLLDPGFEGDLIQWELSLPPILGLEMTRQSEVKHSGNWALRLEGQEKTSWVKASRVGVAQVFCNRNLAGKKVRLSGWAKTDSLLGQVSLKMICHTPDGPVQRTAPGIVGGTSPWTIKTIDTDVPENAYAVWVYMGYQAPNKGVVYIDDISLEIIGSTRGALGP